VSATSDASATSNVPPEEEALPLDFDRCVQQPPELELLAQVCSPRLRLPSPPSPEWAV
jgi:hypothetical protein